MLQLYDEWVFCSVRKTNERGSTTCQSVSSPRREDNVPLISVLQQRVALRNGALPRPLDAVARQIHLTVARFPPQIKFNARSNNGL
jgi:hypothetical protein